MIAALPRAGRLWPKLTSFVINYKYKLVIFISKPQQWKYL